MTGYLRLSKTRGAAPLRLPHLWKSPLRTTRVPRGPGPAGGGRRREDARSGSSAPGRRQPAPAVPFLCSSLPRYVGSRPADRLKATRPAAVLRGTAEPTPASGCRRNSVPPAATASRQPPQPAAPATGLAPSAPADTRRRVAVRGRRIRSAARPPCGGGRPAEAGAGRGGGGRRQRLAPPRSAVLPANWRSGRRARRPARPKFIPSRGRGCPRPALSAARGAGAGWERSACAEGSGGR